MKTDYCLKFLSLFAALVLFDAGSYAQPAGKTEKKATDRLQDWKNPLMMHSHISKPVIDSVRLAPGTKRLAVFFAPGLSYYPFREEDCTRFENSVKSALGRKFRTYDIEIIANGHELRELIPNIYRVSLPPDTARIIRQEPGRQYFVRPLDRETVKAALAGANIALWHSHGYFYEMSLDRWEWQRAKLFGTVEDISVMSYVQPYLAVMLENSGAYVMLPRERDTQINEVIVDNDGSSTGSEFLVEGGEGERAGPGFRINDTIRGALNPFYSGSSLEIAGGQAVFIPRFPAAGEYAVYTAYPFSASASDSVIYTVNHSGGSSRILVNQKMGAGTWVYLGTFTFRQGQNRNTGAVIAVDTGSDPGEHLYADAVRFGGGYGNVARRPSDEMIANQRSVNSEAAQAAASNVSQTLFRWKTSGKPRYLEGARYFLQYAGMPDSLVYSPNLHKNDYNDDYMSRGLWVNYLMSAPGQGSNPGKQSGLGIPLDLSVAFHTDAGITPGDSVIGTLAIYSTATDKGRFPDGRSRMAARDLTDIIQTQVVGDIRTLYKPDWTRRGLWDRPYAEARRPNVPSVLLELLSHQNMADQVFGLDPRFRFSVSRAIYKGILSYLSFTNGTPCIVHPLAPDNLALAYTGGRKVRLSWSPVEDPLEPSATPQRYRISQRINDGGFGKGFITGLTYADIELESFDSIYSFRVTAINDGGESFPSEVLSVGLRNGDSRPVLVVNAFDRISGPAWFDRAGMAGVAWWDDRGVADRLEINAVGDQYDFERNSPWIDDDAPGWGASWSDREGLLIPGNSRDFTITHGRALLSAGKSFISVSDEAFATNDNMGLSSDIIDIILGEEKRTPWPGDSTRNDFSIYTPGFMTRIRELASAGKSIFMSGSYVGSDLFLPGDSSAIKFAEATLHFRHRTGHAVRTGEIRSTDYAGENFSGSFRFNTGYDRNIYAAESPDAIEPSGKGALTAFRYTENNTSAAVMYSGSYRCLVMGFPFETIPGAGERDRLMKQIINFLSE